MALGPKSDLEAFIGRWQGREGGQERANYALFLSELCDVLGVPRPEPAGATGELNDHVFERAVKEPVGDGTYATRRIDLYRRGSFVLEAKQSRQQGGAKEIAGQLALLPSEEPAPRGRRGAHRAWDVLMMNARRQAEGYAKALPAEHGWPPFILVCDVGHGIEVHADFSGQGKNDARFPDPHGFRIHLEDLRRPEARDRLVRIWLDPDSLDPAKKSAQVTRDIAARLAAVSKSLEKAHPAEEVAMFLMRCLFTMFAEDVGLLPEKSFGGVLAKCEADPRKLKPVVGQLWEAMDRGGFAHSIEAFVRQFNSRFFKSTRVLPLGREEIGELRRAAEHDWRDVEPAIFGTLLEQALDPDERRRLGAHDTPRAYVERLVVATVIEPLREDWAQTLSTAERQKAEKRTEDAIRTVKGFHDRLCAVRILNPACGTGNFLDVALELVKRLEGEVLEALADLGGQEALGPRRPYGRSPPVPRPGAQRARHRHRRARLVDRLPAVALPDQGQPAAGADPPGLQEHPADGCGARGRDRPAARRGRQARHARGWRRSRARPRLPEAVPPGLARGRVHRREPALHRRQGPALAARRRVRGSSLGRAPLDERVGRPRHVRVGPRGRAADLEGQRPAPLRPRHHQLDQPRCSSAASSSGT